jgi:ATP-dependent RNA helicase DHX8/PRP22
MAHDDLYNLEFLSLIAKITQEIDNHAGLNDKTLAEFVIDLHDKSTTLADFKAKLKEVGADFPESFIENIDRLVLALHPKHKKKNPAESNGNSKVNGDDTQVEKEIDDMMAQLGLQPRPLGQNLTRIPHHLENVGGRPYRLHEGVASAHHESVAMTGGSNGRSSGKLDERPVLYKIYDGRVQGLKEFGALVQLEGVAGRVEGMSLWPGCLCSLSTPSSGLVHISNIQVGARANSAADLLSRGQPVKVKVMSVAGNRIGLSMKDVDQTTGRDLTPHLRIKSEAELIEEERERASRASTGTNALPLCVKDSGPVRSAKRLTSPERSEIKQLISSGAIDASEYPDLDEDFSNPMARAEVKLSPVKIVKAPDGSLNRAALAGAAFSKEWRELRQQEANEKADAEARDFGAPWQDPMSRDSDRIFAQDLRSLRGQKSHESEGGWRTSTFNKATTFGEITNLSIQDQRKSLPIYKLRGPLLQAIRDVCLSPIFS